MRVEPHGGTSSAPIASATRPAAPRATDDASHHASHAARPTPAKTAVSGDEGGEVTRELRHGEQHHRQPGRQHRRDDDEGLPGSRAKTGADSYRCQHDTGTVGTRAAGRDPVPSSPAASETGVQPLAVGRSTTLRKASSSGRRGRSRRARRAPASHHRDRRRGQPPAKVRAAIRTRPRQQAAVRGKNRIASLPVSFASQATPIATPAATPSFRLGRSAMRNCR